MRGSESETWVGVCGREKYSRFQLEEKVICPRLRVILVVKQRENNEGIYTVCHWHICDGCTEDYVAMRDGNTGIALLTSNPETLSNHFKSCNSCMNLIVN